LPQASEAPRVAPRPISASRRRAEFWPVIAWSAAILLSHIWTYPLLLSGFTVNGTSDVTGTLQNNAFQASIVFRPNLAADPNIPAGTLPTIEQKIAVHEIGHQVMRDAVHRGTPEDIVAYFAASNAEKAKPGWRERINIMNIDVIAVPMNNPTNIASVGSLDLYYFHAKDVARIRKRMNSPGKTD